LHAESVVNAAKNGFHQVQAFQSDLCSAISIERQFDIVIASPPSFSGRLAQKAAGFLCILARRAKLDPRYHEVRGKMYLLIRTSL
jgi:16S rRNA G1207 methylase RsmC